MLRVSRVIGLSSSNIYTAASTLGSSLASTNTLPATATICRHYSQTPPLLGLTAIKKRSPTTKMTKTAAEAHPPKLRKKKGPTVDGRRPRGGLRKAHMKYMKERRERLKVVDSSEDEVWEEYFIANVVERWPFIHPLPKPATKEYWAMKDKMARYGREFPASLNYMDENDWVSEMMDEDEILSHWPYDFKISRDSIHGDSNLTSFGRCLDARVFLMTKGEGGNWEFPTSSVGHESDHLLPQDEYGERRLDPTKTLRKLAEGELVKKCGEKFCDDVWFPTLAPMFMGFDEKDRTKTFYYRSQLIKPFPTSNTMLAEVWGGKEEEGRMVELGKVEYGWLTKEECVEKVKEYDMETAELLRKCL